MKHIVTITQKPVLSGKQSVPDGAICGNGDIGLILGNAEDGLRIYLSKCDLWQGIETGEKGGLKPLGYIDIPVEKRLYDRYHVEQDMDLGEIRCRFGSGEETVGISVRPCRVENSVLLEFTPGAGEPELKVFGGDTAGEKGEIREDGLQGIFRVFSGEDHLYETSCYAFMKSVGEGCRYIAVATNHDTPDPKTFAEKQAREITRERYELLKREHYAAWEKFWSASSVSTPDGELELGWYASQYLLAGCAGNTAFPPGLYGNFITVENPSWHSDYHLNYNYQAPFYAACSSNHPELTDCYHASLEDFAERGREFAAKWGCRGILYPVGLAPKGLCSEMTPSQPLWFKRLFLGQKSNAIHPADILVFRWKATRDPEYARLHAYPYVKDAIAFFEDWMRLEKGRYAIPQDAAHEVPYYRDDFTEEKYKRVINDKNNCLTIGLLRLCIPAAIEMSEVLGEDAEKREQWKDILAKLPDYPTCIRHGARVFRYTEKGMRWNDGNDVGLQHIYPAGGVGELTSDPKLLKIARNTFRQKEKDCYTDQNAVCSFFPMAVRLGRDPAFIIRKLRELNKVGQLPNMLYNFAGGCLENCSVYANTINEMLLQSFEGIVRVFPNWDKATDIAFRSLRADGAFLVSSEMKDGRILYVEIESEKGEPLTLLKPFAETQVSGAQRFRTEGDRMIFETTAGQVIRLTEKAGGGVDKPPFSAVQ